MRQGKWLKYPRYESNSDCPRESSLDGFSISAASSDSRYLAQTSPDYAVRIIDRLTRRSIQIAQFPNSGRMVPEYDRNEIREVIEGKYRIIYASWGCSSPSPCCDSQHAGPTALTRVNSRATLTRFLDSLRSGSIVLSVAIFALLLTRSLLASLTVWH